MQTILIFVDGFGWGQTDPTRNPMLSYGGELFRFADTAGDSEAPDGAPRPTAGGGWVRPIDAVLGVDGVPQSATGQTTLLTGVNAQAHLGKHLTGFPNPQLRELLLAHSVLKRLADAGRRARFLNAFRPRFFELSRERQLTFSATTVANLAGDLPFCTLDDIRAHRSIYQEFTNGDLIDRGFDVPLMAPAEAGRILARQGRTNDFTLFEYFQTDRAGHSADPELCHAELGKLDEFLIALLDEVAQDLADDLLVVLTSDHGNIEDITTRRHTTNPIPLMAWGRDAQDFVAGVSDLAGVAPRILARHDV